jgi:hypothetical protein
LINEVDVAETEAKMARYEKENKDSIAANEARSVSICYIYDVGCIRIDY